MCYRKNIIADTMVDLEARSFCFNPFSGSPCVGLGEQSLRAFFRSSSGDRQGASANGAEISRTQKRHPARGTPCATGPDSHRGIGASRGRVVTSNALPIESVPLGCAGVGFLKVSAEVRDVDTRFRVGQVGRSVRQTPSKNPLGDGGSVVITLAETMEKRD